MAAKFRNSTETEAGINLAASHRIAKGQAINKIKLKAHGCFY
jgi:hypothetical protein